MSKFYFKENVNIEDCSFIFLCGVNYKRNNSSDKRNVLEKHLREQNEHYCPIILEKYFIPSSKSNRNKYLTYVEAGFKNLYQVEMLVNYLSDCNIIILESISTGAEAGMFLGVPKSQKKTLLLVPDDMAVEKDMRGNFLKLAFSISDAEFRMFYPSVENHSVSKNVSEWRTSFFNDIIGKNLSSQICDFIERNKYSRIFKLSFTRTKSQLGSGKIYYKIEGSNLNILIEPRTLMVCVGALLSCKYYSDMFFEKKGKTIIDIEKTIVEWLKEVFINSINENKKEEVDNCKIKIAASISEMTVNRVIGMVLYLFSAAKFIEIKKDKDYVTSRFVIMKRKFYCDNTKKNRLYFEKYARLIDEIVEEQII